MLVGHKELYVLIAHGVVRSFIVIAQLEEPVSAVRIISGIEFFLIGQQNLQLFLNLPYVIIHMKSIQQLHHRMPFVVQMLGTNPESTPCTPHAHCKVQLGLP